MKAVQKGFTLIELMIVVAIIAILAAIAIPAYQDFMVRSAVSEMLVSASACKNNVAEYWQDKAAWPPTPADAGCSNVGTAKTLAPSVSAANGEVTVSASPTSSLGLKLGAGTDTLALAPSDGVAPGTLATPAPNQPIGEWICHPGAGGSSTTIAVKYLPSTCRP